MSSTQTSTKLNAYPISRSGWPFLLLLKFMLTVPARETKYKTSLFCHCSWTILRTLTDSWYSLMSHMSFWLQEGDDVITEITSGFSALITPSRSFSRSTVIEWPWSLGKSEWKSWNYRPYLSFLRPDMVFFQNPDKGVCLWKVWLVL